VSSAVRVVGGSLGLMALAPLLLEVLVCPEDHQPLWYFDDEQVLFNERLRRSYAVVDGIPDLLIEDATAVSDADHDRLVAKAAGGGAVRTTATA
jgi:uncharacterized protein